MVADEGREGCGSASPSQKSLFDQSVSPPLSLAHFEAAAVSAGRVDHSHHLFGLHPPDGVFQGGELNEGKSSARTYIGMETTTNFKRGFIPIEPWLKTGEWGGTRESASGFYMIAAGALSLEIRQFLTC